MINSIKSQKHLLKMGFIHKLFLPENKKIKQTVLETVCNYSVGPVLIKCF